jgi:hypothetical protein
MVAVIGAETGEEETIFQGRSLESLKRMFMLADEAQNTARTLAFRDRDWYDNFDDDQWSDGEKKILGDRHQDPATRNEIKRKVNFLIGFEQRSRTDPRAFPRTPKDEDGAKVATDCLDYIETVTRFDRAASMAFKDLTIEGIEAAEVVVEQGNITVNRIDFSKFFYDPRSREPDFSDARYMGYADWWDIDEAEGMFPGEEAQAALKGAYDVETTDVGREDKPECLWGDKDRQRVRVIVVYYKAANGDWNYAYYTGGGILREGPSAYLTEEGRPTNCIIAQSAYVTRENERFGLVRDMIALQREVNHRLSLSLFLLKNRRMWQSRDGVLDKDARTQAARADGIITAKGAYEQEWGFVNSSGEITGNFELLQQALAGMAAQGPNAGLQGRGTEDQSGRAIIAQQSAGLTEENTIYDGHNDWKLRIYRAMWERAKQFWTEPDFIRVTDDENAYRFIPINQPVIDQMTGRPVADPSGVPKLQNPLAQMDVDIIIEAAPDVISLQHEQFQQLADLAKTGVPIPPDLLIKASQLRNKNELLESLKAQQQAQAQDPFTQTMKQLEAMQAKANVEKTQSETQKNAIGTELDKVRAMGEVIENIIRQNAEQTPAKVTVSA